MFFFQADILAADGQLLKLGLLFAADMDMSLEEQPEYYSFHHKLIQEHLAARFLTQRVKNDWESFRAVFPDWQKDIEKGPHREVLKFMVEMDASIMEHVCRTYADYVTTESYRTVGDLSVLTDLQTEAVPSGTVAASTVALYHYKCDSVRSITDHLFSGYEWDSDESISDHSLRVDECDFDPAIPNLSFREDDCDFDKALSNLSIREDECDSDKAIPNIPVRQALLSAYLVVIEGIKDLGLMPLPVKTDINETCQHHTRALLMEDCSYNVVKHVMESIQGIPITHLYMKDCSTGYNGSDSDSDEGNVSVPCHVQASRCHQLDDLSLHDNDLRGQAAALTLHSDSNSDKSNVSRKGFKSINIGSSQSECCTNTANDSLTLCRQARGLCMGYNILPMGELRQLCQQLKGCQQLRTLHLEGVKAVMPDGSVIKHLPNELLKVMCHLNKLQVIRLGGNPLGVHGKYITQAINTWQPEPQLKVLHLGFCKLPRKVTGGLLQALATRCLQLEELNLVYNDLGDQLTALTSHTHPLLKWLELEKCNLQSADGHALAAAIQQQRLPQRVWLGLHDNPSLGEEAVTAILTAALTHHQRELCIQLKECNMSEQFAEEWRQKCMNTNVKVSFNYLDF